MAASVGLWSTAFRPDRRRYTPGDASFEEIRANAIIKGALFDDAEDLEAESVQIRLKYMSHWFGLGKFEHARSKLNTTLTFTAQPTEHTQLADGSTFSILHGASTGSDDVISRTISQDYLLIVRYPGLRDFLDLLDVASDLQDLVSIGTGAIAEYQDIIFTRSDLGETTLAGTPTGSEKNLKYYARWNVRDTRDKKRPLHWTDMYFSYMDLGGMAGVKRWLDAVPDNRSSLARVVATQYGRDHMFVTDRLFNCAAAVEGFDRRTLHPKRDELKNRLDRCVKLAGPEFQEICGADVATWGKSIVHYRNDVAHHLGRDIKRGSFDQAYLAESLYWLLIFCLLRQAQMPDSLFKKIVEHPQIQFLAPKVRAAAASI